MKKISKEKVLASIGVTALTFAPLFAFAQNTKVFDLLVQVQKWANALIPIMMALAFVYFVWAVISFINGTDAEKKKESQAKMINGIIGIVVMGSIWGITAFLSGVVGIDNTSTSNLKVISF